MSPSRGFNLLVRARLNICRPQAIRNYTKPPHLEFVSKVTDPRNKTQLYISKSDDPYLNLSIEHYLLQKTPADSTVLFLYLNRPSIIIGRNQNPWNEVNLSAQRIGKSKVEPNLVRRRSGGGTVFHDHGNVNYSVICPTRDFDRDKHARMVVRALQNLGVEKVRVNKRHDIELYDTIRQVEYKTAPDGSVPPSVDTVFKISGSAYKLTRLRALHHGTCLVSSDNIWLIPSFLRSPLKPFLKAKGVDSVRSPIQNVQVNNEFGTDEFTEAVAEEFHRLHGGDRWMELGSVCGGVPEIAKGMDELKSDDWIYGQTPPFTFSTVKEGFGGLPSQPDRSLLPYPANFTAKFEAKHGAITSMELQIHAVEGGTYDVNVEALVGQKIRDITSWKKAFAADSLSPNASYASDLHSEIEVAGDEMDSLFGN